MSEAEIARAYLNQQLADQADPDVWAAWVAFRDASEGLGHQRLVDALTDTNLMIQTAVRKERERLIAIFYNYADVEGDSEHLSLNTAMKIVKEMRGEDGW